MVRNFFTVYLNFVKLIMGMAVWILSLLYIYSNHADPAAPAPDFVTVVTEPDGWFTSNNNLLVLSIAILIIFPTVIAGLALRFKSVGKQDYYALVDGLIVALFHSFVALALLLCMHAWFFMGTSTGKLFGEGLKELFGFATTLFAFMAGFSLFYSLQKFSAAQTKLDDEISAWDSLYDLLSFFRFDGNDGGGGGGGEAVKQAAKHEAENNKSAVSCITEMRRLANGRDPDRILGNVYSSIVQLRAVDDNDKAALPALINQYCALQVLLRQREQISTDSGGVPKLIKIVEWLLTGTVLLIASLAANDIVFGVTTPPGSTSGAEAVVLTANNLFYFSGILMVFTFTIFVLHRAIVDLADPFNGSFSIEVEKQYVELIARIETKEATRPVFDS